MSSVPTRDWALVRPLIADLIGAVVDFFVLGGGGLTGARGRRRDYRRGLPVFIRVGVQGAFPNADHLRLHGNRIWVVSNKGFDAERRTEIKPEGEVEVVRSGLLHFPRVVIRVDGKPIRVSSPDDSKLLAEAFERWRNPIE